MRTPCIATWALVAAAAAAGLSFAAQDRPQDPAKGTPQDAAMMAPQPTAEHAALRMDEGTWKATVDWWMAPNTEPMKSTGVENNKLSCNGLWLVSDFKSDDGMFMGHGFTGYDTEKKQYVGVWVDSMTTAPSFSDGSFDKTKKTFTYTGEMKDSATGKTVKTRTIVTYPDANSRHLVSWATGADGKEWKQLEIHYTRAGK